MSTTSGPAPTGSGAQKTPVSPGAFSFRPVTANSKGKFVKALIYGAAGSGKTTLAGSASNIEQASDVLLVTAEGGDIVFQDNPRVERPQLIDQMRMTRIEQVQKTYEWLLHHCRARDNNDRATLAMLQNQAFFGQKTIPDDLDPELRAQLEPERIRLYRTVIMDSLTDIEALNMNHVLGLADKGFDVGDDLTPAGYTEFRKNNNTIQQLVRAFRNLPIHLFIICGQKWSQDEQKKFHYSPWMTGQLATQIQSFVDIVGYMVTSTDDQSKECRKLYVQPQAAVRFDAKCRIASFDKPFFMNPSVEDILRQCKYL